MMIVTQLTEIEECDQNSRNNGPLLEKVGREERFGSQLLARFPKWEDE
jgi:hypothetical protein